MNFSSPIMRRQAVSEKFFPCAFTRAAWSSVAEICPERSLSTVINHCCTSGFTELGAPNPGLNAGCCRLLVSYYTSQLGTTVNIIIYNKCKILLY